MRERNCSWCGEQLPADAGNTRKFCDTICKDRARYKRQHPKTERPCLWCGKTLVAAGLRKFCDRRCSQRFAWRVAHPPAVDRVCASCGKPLIGKKAHAVYCDRSCKNRSAQLRLRTNNPEQRQKDRARYLRERERRIAYATEYHKRKPHVGQTTKRNRRSASATGKVRPADWKRLCARYGGRCAYCGEQRPLTMDHVVPLVRGGANTIGNILPACRSCNCRKQGRFLMEWRLGLSRRTSRSTYAVDALRAGRAPDAGMGRP